MPNQSKKLPETSERSKSTEQSDQTGPPPLTDYPNIEFVARLLAGMPPDIASSFSERQLFAIQQAVGPYDGKEARAGWKATIWMPWASYLISLRRVRR